MKFRGLVLALALMAPSSALADPITLAGVWGSPNASFGSELGDASATPFWAGASWDCALCGIGYLIDAFGTENIEYLHDGTGQAAGFRFDPESDISLPSLLFSITAWTGGTFGRRADGAFTYDSGTGHVSNSWDNGEQYALFRIVGPDTTRYFLGIEDILVSFPTDGDHNDYIVTFTETPHSVPEPSSLLLMGCALAAAAMRKVRSSRQLQTNSAV
jgi:hypothetical protein